MKNILTFFILVFIISYACNRTLISFNEQKTEEITVTNQSTFEINLTGIPSSGYNWYISEKSDTSLVSLVSKETVKEQNDDVPRLGGKVNEIWKFKANEKGKANLILYYKRQWENKAPLDSMYYKIKIK